MCKEPDSIVFQIELLRDNFLRKSKLFFTLEEIQKLDDAIIASVEKTLESIIIRRKDE